MRAFLFYRIITIVILVSVGCSFIPITASAADNDWQFKAEAYLTLQEQYLGLAEHHICALSEL